jgi:SAM-dependent methyltransferase
MTHHHHHKGADHGNQHDSGLAELLDLDAEVLGSYLDDLTGWVAQFATDDPGLIVDIGAGTGTGTLALTRRFPQATVVAIDRSAGMLQRVEAAAREHGVDGRVRTTQADLDIRWPDLAGIDIAWASSSVHEMTDPDQLFREVFAALAPGGVLAVIEMEAQPTFLADDDGLEARLHEAMAQAGWNAYAEWRPRLERAGFTVVGQQRFTMDVSGASSATARYARASLSNARSGLAGQLADADLAAIDQLLADGALEALLQSRDAPVRVARLAWAARRPA